jgi:hypothetical protein
MGSGLKIRRRFLAAVEKRYLLRGERSDPPQAFGLNDRPRAEFERLDPVVRVEEIAPPGHRPVILEEDNVVTGGERLRDIAPELLAPRHCIRRISYAAADGVGLRDHRSVRDDPDDAEGDQRSGMGMNDRRDVGPAFVDPAVERELRRRGVGAHAHAVGPDAHDVVGGEVTLVDPRRRDPDVAVDVPDGEIAAGERGEPVVIDAVHDPHDLVARVQKVKVHNRRIPRRLRSVCPGRGTPGRVPRGNVRKG